MIKIYPIAIEIKYCSPIKVIKWYDLIFWEYPFFIHSRH